MNMEIDPTEVEQKAYNESVQDGLLEILLGIHFIIIGNNILRFIKMNLIVYGGRTNGQ